MFWRYHDLCSSNIDTILGSDDVTLQKLMDEDFIIQECKSGNAKLLNFLTRPEVLDELVSLVTKEPPVDSPEAVRFKYNNIAAEVLTCDLDMITTSLATSERLDQLCDFLKTDSELNPLMASFFSKTFSLLVTRKSKTLLEYLKNRENFLPRVLKHLRTSAIMDLLVKMITNMDDVETRQLYTQWLSEERFVEQTITLLDPSGDSSLHGNVAQLISDIVRILRDYQAQAAVMKYGDFSGSTSDTNQEVNLVLSTLESKTTVDLLLSHILDKEPTESSLVYGIITLLALLEPRKTMSLLGNIEAESGDRPLTQPAVTTCFRNIVEAAVPRLKDFHHLLVSFPQKVASHVKFVEKPLGAVRLQVTRLFAALLRTGSWEVQKEMAALGTFGILLDMFVEYSHNSFLHGQVERSIQYIFGLKPLRLLQPSTEIAQEAVTTSEDLPHSHPLLSNLLVDHKLTERILSAWEANKSSESGGGRRLSYMGHLIRMANHVTEYRKNGANSEEIQNIFNQLPEETQKRWDEFVETELLQANRVSEILPVKSEVSAPKSSSEDEFIEMRHNSPRDTAAQEAFTEYQTELLSKPVVNRFGFPDNQFTDNEEHSRAPPENLANISLPEDDDELQSQSAAAFEQLCSERIQMGDIGALPMSTSDLTDPWPENKKNSDLTEDKVVDMDIDTPEGPVAVDTSNPWENPTGWNAEQGSDNWADFGNFQSSDSPNFDFASAFQNPGTSDSGNAVQDQAVPPEQNEQSQTSSQIDGEKGQQGNGPV